MRIRLLAPFVVLVAAAAGSSCKKDPPPAPAPAASSSALKEAFPVPNDLTFNPLLELAAQSSARAAAAAPPDADGGTPDVRTRAGDASVEVHRATLKQAGADPKSPLVYDFAIGKPESVVASIKASSREEMPGKPPGGGDQPPVRFTLMLVPKVRAPDGRVQFAAKVTKAEILQVGGTPLPKEVREQIDLVTGAIMKVSGSFTVDPHGVLGDPTFSLGEGAPPAMNEIAQLLQQSLELLFTLMPEEPVGVGAQWGSTSTNMEGNGTLAATYTLKERTPTSAVIRVETLRSMPSQRVPDPRAPPGSTMEMKGKGGYTVNVRLTGPASKAVGETETRIAIKDPTTTPPRLMTQVLKVAQTIDAVK